MDGWQFDSVGGQAVLRRKQKPERREASREKDKIREGIACNPSLFLHDTSEKRKSIFATPCKRKTMKDLQEEIRSLASGNGSILKGMLLLAEHIEKLEERIQKMEESGCKCSRSKQKEHIMCRSETPLHGVLYSE